MFSPKWEECGAFPVFASDICLTTEEKAQKNISQGSRRVLVGMMRTEYTGTEHT